ncbi:hypothetical protein MARA_20410 [Mycolicibacterium arabiense]|uniref:Uncharacterized protein n=1 Tax=Mycolicibacterium arabiense TaxID=1286181 RepID=A0A7I7RVQ4_9MYCO|nr:hypothetical protein MARA_20410 [Mycolicibacterium arabiense]
MFSDPRTLEIPALPADRGDESTRVRDPIQPDCALRPTCDSVRNRGGLSVCKTLHLVADKRYGYKMF